MATNSLLYAVWILYKSGIRPSFIEFMKKDHLKKIWETGLFSKISIMHSEKADDGGYLRSVILYRPKNKEAWDTYTTEHQPALSAEYKTQFGTELHNGSMKPDRILAEEEVVFEE